MLITLVKQGVTVYYFVYVRYLKLLTRIMFLTQLLKPLLALYYSKGLIEMENIHN